MNTKTVAKFDDSKYQSDVYQRTKPTRSNEDASGIKYIRPRVIAPNAFQGPLRGIAWSNVGTSHAVVTTADHGLATLVQPPNFSTIPSLHSINGERIIDEYRELSKLTEVLCVTILRCCNLETHNRAQVLQIEWLENNIHQNRSTIEKMYKNELENAKKLLYEGTQSKPELETKANALDKKIPSYDEQYKYILAKRDQTTQELFNYEQRIAQNNAEGQFLHRRTRNLDDESKFYLLKNQALHARQVRLRYLFDEENFAKQTLETELEILRSEKITNEDIRTTAIDEARQSIDISQVAGFQPSKYFSDQLSQELQRIRQEYEKKIEVYREELHRNFELELYRLQLDKIRPAPTVTRDHEVQLQQYQELLKEIQQQVTIEREKQRNIVFRIEEIKTKNTAAHSDHQSRLEKQRYLTTLNQLIRDRENQLDDALRIRKIHKQKIEEYRERLNHHQNHTAKRLTIHESDFTSLSHKSSLPKGTFRSSLQELSSNYRVSSTTNTVQYAQRSILKKNENDYSVSTVEQDCRTLHRLLNDTPIGELSVSRVICSQALAQRLQIRDQYKQLFKKNLGDDLERISDDSLSKFLRLLLLSPIEHDCFELRRVLNRTTIDRNVLVELLFTRTSQHIQNVRQAYFKLFRSTIEEDLRTDRDDHSKHLLVALLRSNRPEEVAIVDDEIIQDAKELFETESKWRVDGSTLVRLLCTRSNAQLAQLFTAYQQYSHVDIEQTIQKNIEGHLYHTLIAIIRLIRNQARFFANELKKCLKNVKANEDDLNRIIVTRCEIDMAQIRVEYEKLTTYNLHDHIQLEVFGNYKRAILEFLRQRGAGNTSDTHSQTSRQPARFFRSGVQWREPVDRSNRDTGTGRTMTRSVTEYSMSEPQNIHTKGNFTNIFSDRNALTVNARPLGTNQRQFVSLTTMPESEANEQ
ncbi:unnamed protein product [Adineta ricciae]|uniref:Annexin n=1 Tax=Adineta ricciae TaxID=249248 RepID=A0A815W3R3_ADIRI|nr:unnamed protein product [Adineta ricciae]CAF1543482.1 unnamed protein product [Adineta ricciae]